MIRTLKLGEVEMPLVESFVLGKNRNYGDRSTKDFTVTGTYAEVAAMVADNMSWSIICTEENGEAQAFSNDEYSQVGDIIVHRNGTVTVTMVKPSELDLANAALDELVLAELSE